MIDAILGQVRNTSLIMGLVAFIGLSLQKKKPTDILTGTMKTVIGFMIFNIGSGALGSIVENFTTLFNAGFGIEGVTTQVEIATALALNEFGTEVALVLVIGFVANVIIARYTKFKSIFLTGQHFLYFASVIALIFVGHGSSTIMTVLLGGIILGFAGAALPTLVQPYMNELMGSDDIALGHFNLFGYRLAADIGNIIGKLDGKRGKSQNSKKDVDSMKLPGWLSLFRDFTFSVGIFMTVLFYIAVIAAIVNGEMGLVQEMSGTDIWFIYPLLQGMQFAAGMSVLIYGVRQFIAAITEAFVAISDKYIPDSRPAVDCPAIFPYAPNAVILGFVGAMLGGLFGMGLMIFFNSPIIMIPAAGIAFFSGGTSGVFGSIRGGWKGALLGSFIVGIGLVVLPLILYPAFSELGISGASFPNIDYNIVGAILDWILSLFS